MTVWQEIRNRFPGNRKAGRDRTLESGVLVLDIAVSGLDVESDTVSGLAGLPVRHGAYRLAELSWVSWPGSGMRQEARSAEAEQRYGELVAQARCFPILTFNAAFVRAMLDRQARRFGVSPLLGQWVDLGLALRGVLGADMGISLSLRQWQDRFGIPLGPEHDAKADVVAMAQLWLVLMAGCEEQGIETFGQLQEAWESSEWLAGR